MIQQIRYSQSSVNAYLPADALAAGTDNVRSAQLTGRVNSWAGSLVPQGTGALLQAVPDSASLKKRGQSTPSVKPIYVLAPAFKLPKVAASSTVIRSLFPESSVVLRVAGVPQAKVMLFSEEQSAAILAALHKPMIRQFSLLDDDRKKVVARTLMLAALYELQRGTILPSEFSFVVMQILSVARNLDLPTIGKAVLSPVPSQTKVPASAANRSSRAVPGPTELPAVDRVTKEQKAKADALEIFETHQNAKTLSHQQKEVLARIVYRTWEIQQRSRQTKLDFVAFLKNAGGMQWIDWVDSAKDTGVGLSLLRGWKSDLRRRAGEQSTVVIDIQLAFPNEAEKQAIAAQLFVNGKNLSQAIQEAKIGAPVEATSLSTSSFRILVEPSVTYRRNPQSLGSNKLHTEFPVAVANQLDALLPGVDWRPDRNAATGSFVIRSGPSTGKQVLGTARSSGGEHNVWTFTLTTRDYASTQAMARLNPAMVQELNLRYGAGQWSCRAKGTDVIKILSKAGNRELLEEVKIESNKVQVFLPKVSTPTREMSKVDLGDSLIQSINTKVGRTDWQMLATKVDGVFEVVDPASKIVFGKIRQSETASFFTFTLVKRINRPAKNYEPELGAAFVKRCDDAFGAGTWRLEKNGSHRYQVHRVAGSRVPGESYFLGSMTSTNEGRSWNLFVSPGAKKIAQ